MILCENQEKLNIGLMISYDLQFFADGPGGEKTEQPTAKKLQDARQEGQVAKSQEIGHAAGLMALFIMIRVLYPYMGTNFSNTFRYVYTQIPDIIVMHNGNMPFTNLRVILTQTLLRILLTAIPFLAVALIIAFICNVVQVGWKITTKPLRPKLSKLNPIKGFKKIFSTRKIFDLVKAIAKIAVIGVVVYTYFLSYTASIFTLYDMPLRQGIGLMGNTIVEVGIRIAAVYVVIAAIDYVYQKRKFRKDMMMTKQEVKDEYKNTEGDPQIKGQQRRRMMQASQRRMMQELPKADVVITNPTHYAVAISYDAEKYDAPRVIAKGEGYLAQRIKDIAKENNIEIVENKPLARMLYANVDVGEFVPPELYQAVAEVLAFVYHLQGKV
ncbi:flagellar biosynthesis protein FlhB [Butyrivibrio sp. LC3010]|uniref:flagellar biosynthesis protein FlhB n=1 Tax=Butyrivibrio sp. LC3010 TaxID=1280680 RepID=UPI000403344F|nr:flagellar biosynthesis protein FlhB [Butyrivibrio sp. LC3010]